MQRIAVTQKGLPACTLSGKRRESKAEAVELSIPTRLDADMISGMCALNANETYQFSVLFVTTEFIYGEDRQAGVQTQIFLADL
jgi:hypothetical protein